ncbi:MAG: hypothetical protein ABR591_00285 [Candidatus Velthaea sp.]
MDLLPQAAAVVAPGGGGGGTVATGGIPSPTVDGAAAYLQSPIAPPPSAANNLAANFDVLQSGGIPPSRSRSAGFSIYNIRKKTPLTFSAVAIAGANSGDFTVSAAGVSAVRRVPAHGRRRAHGDASSDDQRRDPKLPHERYGASESADRRVRPAPGELQLVHGSELHEHPDLLARARRSDVRQRRRAAPYPARVSNAPRFEGETLAPFRSAAWIWLRAAS